MGWIIILSVACGLAIAWFAQRRGFARGKEQGFREGINAGRQRSWDAGYKAGREQLEQRAAQIGEQATQMYSAAFLAGEENQRKLEHAALQRKYGNFGRVEVM